MEKGWTSKEIDTFMEFEKKRKNNELGPPIRFKTVSKLSAWLKQ